MTLVLVYSCKDKSTKDNKSKTNETIVSVKSSKDSLTKTIEKPDTLNYALSEIFAKAIQCFPNDSASLYRFYFKWNSTKDQDKINKQIKRLEKLTSNESVKRYRDVNNYLKPLLKEIVNSNAVTKSQADSLVKLYSDYDYFSGESLFSQLLTMEDNYDLVWKSFQIMARESSKDTCFISALIKLKNNIRTNAELSESMGAFVVKAIQNNPTGFLEMYSHRKGKTRSDFANYIMVWEDPDKELVEKFTEISKNSKDENYKKLAIDLIDKFKN